MAIAHDVKTVSPLGQVYIQLADALNRAVASYKEAALVRKTRAELYDLSDRELADIGIHRAQIRSLDLTPNA